MKYHIVKDADFFLIKISGETIKNEPLPAKRILSPYLKEKGIRVIMDLKELFIRCEAQQNTGQVD